MGEVLNVGAVITLIAVGWSFAALLTSHARKTWFEGTHVRDGVELRKSNW